MSETPGKLHIDDDWKSEAAREKERLAETAAASGPRDVPAADFSGLVQMIAMQALIGLGGFAGPGGQEIPPNPELAKHHIDMLEVLEKKTAGNLDANEKALLDTTLHQLRMAYVETMRFGGGAPPR